MAEHHRKKTEKLKTYWKEKAKRQYAAKKELRRQQQKENYDRRAVDLPRRLERMLPAVKHRAKIAGLDFDLTKEWLQQQPLMCAVSGIPFVLTEKGHGPLSPSFDRMDRTKGYVQGNVQIVSYFYNTAKNQWGDEAAQDLIISYAEAFQKLRSVA